MITMGRSVAMGLRVIEAKGVDKRWWEREEREREKGERCEQQNRGRCDGRASEARPEVNRDEA